MKKIFSNQYFRYSLFLIVGLLIGWAVFHSSGKNEKENNHQVQESKAEVWTCSMHPQIRMDKPGKCPICAMDLILLNQSGGATSDPMAIHLTKEAAQLANVLTTVVGRQNPVKELRLYGKVQADERLRQNQVSHLSGRIEKLLVNFTGEPIQKGQKLAVVYSPELVTAQQELIEASKTKQAQPAIYEAAKERLLQWKLTEAQISDIEGSGNVRANVDVVSNSNGIVTARRVNSGDYVNQGSVLFEISDLSRVWVLFDAYESDLPFLKQGDKIDFTLLALPGTSYSGTVRFIDPVIDPTNRVAKIRVEMSNPGAKLKPEMFATGIVKSNLEEFKDKLVIPRSAVLWTGKRSIVYVKQAGEEPVFKIREIELGPQLGYSYVVTDGLTDGEEIVTEGAFSVDAAAQLEGKPSMMNPLGGMVSIGHNHNSGDAVSEEEHSSHQNQQSSETEVHEMLKVAGKCDLCKERIETAAKSVAGVTKAEWRAETQQLHLSFLSTKTTVDQVAKAIAAVGHDTEKFKASDSVYKTLPECCLYNRLK
ncbi:MAG: efflux transporter periplasmic adaptor subunit [Candidatus Marinimicrobia bacterium CG1_02_48_14]|nr:MAG: efflux transporter periplasmic adaptor subunit [Candidatus Marinimicrobia bacterium CG1_02_48_14]